MRKTLKKIERVTKKGVGMDDTVKDVKKDFRIPL